MKKHDLICKLIVHFVILPEFKWKSLQGFVAERQGERDEMQDAHVIIDDFTSEFPNLPSSV